MTVQLGSVACTASKLNIVRMKHRLGFPGLGVKLHLWRRSLERILRVSQVLDDSTVHRFNL